MKRKVGWIVHKVWRQEKKWAWVALGVLVANIFAALSEGLSFSAILFAISSLQEESSLKWESLPSFFSFYLNAISFFAISHFKPFSFFLILAVGFQVMRSALSYLGQLGTTFFAAHMENKLKKQVYQQILRMSFSSVNRYKVGDLVEYIKTPSILIQDICNAINLVALSFLVSAAFAWLMLLLSPFLTLISFLSFGALAIFQKLIIRKIGAISQSFSDHTVEFSKQIVQHLYALRVIHLFNRRQDVMKKGSQTLDEISKSTKRLYIWNHATIPMNEILGVGLVGAFLVFGQMLLKETPLTVPVLLTFVTILHRLNGRVHHILGGVSLIATRWGQILRLSDILSSEGKEYAAEGGAPFLKFKKEISFLNVDLRYPDSKTLALQGLSFTLQKGNVIAFVGHSGAGKSSLIDLLSGLYAPSRGEIFIDGKDLQQIDMRDWREKLGIVSQESFIFHETIEENIRFGKSDASEEEVQRAAQRAGAHEFIEKLPQKYKTVVGERGYLLSGGERQRVSLARALIRDPEILILDEATSSLDSESELLIQETLNRLKGEKTIFLVAHRLSTVTRADQIFVLKEGKIIESGSHEALLNKRGQYSFFWQLQTAKHF